MVSEVHVCLGLGVEEKVRREQEMEAMDAGFDDLMQELGTGGMMRPKFDKFDPSTWGSKEKDESKDQWYDASMRKLGQESVVAASERLKTPEELRAERSKKLVRMEQERLERQNKDVVSMLDVKKRQPLVKADGKGVLSGALEGVENSDSEEDENMQIPLDAFSASEDEDEAAGGGKGKKGLGFGAARAAGSAGEDEDESKGEEWEESEGEGDLEEGGEDDLELLKRCP